MSHRNVIPAQGGAILHQLLSAAPALSIRLARRLAVAFASDGYFFSTTYMTSLANNCLTVLLTGALCGSARAHAQQPTRAVSPDSAVVLYCAAWNTDSQAERARLLERVWTPDGVYSDPNPTRTVGRAALSDSIAALRRRYPGARFHCSAPQTHHAAMRATWLYLRPDETEVARGEDFYELAPDGRIKRVTGFFGAAPVVKR